MGGGKAVRGPCLVRARMSSFFVGQAGVHGLATDLVVRGPRRRLGLRRRPVLTRVSGVLAVLFVLFARSGHLRVTLSRGFFRWLTAATGVAWYPLQEWPRREPLCHPHRGRDPPRRVFPPTRCVRFSAATGWWRGRCTRYGRRSFPRPCPVGHPRPIFRHAPAGVCRAPPFPALPLHLQQPRWAAAGAIGLCSSEDDKRSARTSTSGSDLPGRAHRAGGVVGSSGPWDAPQRSPSSAVRPTTECGLGRPTAGGAAAGLVGLPRQLGGRGIHVGFGGCNDSGGSDVCRWWLGRCRRWLGCGSRPRHAAVVSDGNADEAAWLALPCEPIHSGPSDFDWGGNKGHG